MFSKYLLKTSIGGLKTHKFRSGLTILGIIIGITAIMLVMSLGKGAQDLILSQIQGLGSKTIIVLPGRQPDTGDMASMVEIILGDSLKEKDLEALKKKSNVPHLAKIMPIVYGSGSASRESETYQLIILGASELLPELQVNLNPERGLFFEAEDVKNYADVAVIGVKVKEELFGSEEAVGKNIRIKGRNLRVIGVLPSKGNVALINLDEAAIIPYTTAQQYIFGIKHFNRLWIEADFEKNIPKTVEDIKITLRNLHNITDPEKDDFSVQTQENVMESVGMIMDIMTWFLVSVAAISLLVGGIGIMNIMLVSVKERTREIGLRKAVGATTGNILAQFLLEAVILTLTGGIAGIFLGCSFSFIVSFALSKILILNWQFSFPVLGTILGISASALIGLIFGLYPARKASMKSPIEALRYE